MTLLPYCPLEKPLSFIPGGNFAKDGLQYQPLSAVYSNKVQAFWDKLNETRQRTDEAIRKFSEMDTAELAERWENWDEEAIDSFRVQFQVIDLNQDGLIDFHELCNALDDIGDTSSYEDRREYFDEVDADRSEGIDFEEFLQLLHQVEIGEASCERGLGAVLINTIQSSSLLKSEDTGNNGDTQMIIRLRQLSILQLLQGALF